MQIQPAESFCFQLNLGRVSMVTMPSDYLPRRVDWSKWVDCETSAIKVGQDQVIATPKVYASPDHDDEKDNSRSSSLHEKRGLEQIDPMKILAETTENTRILLVGSWFHPIPSWSQSVQAIRASQFAAHYPKVLQSQVATWKPISNRLVAGGSFLVADDNGRLSGMTGIANAWIARQERAGIYHEVKSKSWFACAIDLLNPVTAGAAPLKLHRLAVIDPEKWCGSPTPEKPILDLILSNPECAELWISSPGLGLSLWLANLRERNPADLRDVVIPSAVLGWHPLRDAMAFLSQAANGSVLLLVDRHSRLQVLLKENGGAAT